MIEILHLERGFAAKFIKFKADLGATDGAVPQHRAGAAMEFIFLACAAARGD